jgi:hypothetical protein
MEWDLEDLIKALRAYPADHPSPVTWEPCSHRWDYSQLAFVVTYEAGTVGDLLAKAEEANGATYEGYKGGDNLMDLKTEVFATNCHSECGSPIGPHLLRAWLGPVPVVLPEGCRVDGDERCFVDDGAIVSWVAGGLLIEAGRPVRVGVGPKVLHWLRTGEVTP